MGINTDFIKQTIANRTIYRILFNQLVKQECASVFGKTIDLAGGNNASYYSYLPSNLDIVRTNINFAVGQKNGLVIDLNKNFPLETNTFDVVLFFNAVYIVEDRVKTLKEVKRILKDDGTLFLVSPFIANEMPEPHDYCRLTYEGLEGEFKRAGFNNIKIKRFGERFSSAVYLLSPFWFTWVIKLLVYSISLILDKCIPKKTRKEYPTPLGYFCIIKK